MSDIDLTWQSGIGGEVRGHGLFSRNFYDKAAENCWEWKTDMWPDLTHTFRIVAKFDLSEFDESGAKFISRLNGVIILNSNMRYIMEYWQER